MTRGAGDPESRIVPGPFDPASPSRPGDATEDALVAALDAAGLGGYVRQHPFAKALGRKYRADVAYPEARLIVESEGGPHTIRRQWAKDCERYSIAAALGYRIVRCTKESIEDGLATEWVRLALGKHIDNQPREGAQREGE